MATVAAMAATKTIPIVFMVGRNPVKAGFVARLNRPGGNATGVNILTSELAAKRLQLLRDLIPDLGLIGVLVNPDNPNAATDPQDLQDAAATLGLKLSFLQARTPDEIAQAFASFAAQKLKAVLVNTDPYYLGRRDHLAELAARHSRAGDLFVARACQGWRSDQLRRQFDRGLPAIRRLRRTDSAWQQAG